MKCPSCGAEGQAGSYCGECGAALDATCAACGSEFPPGARFCTACGEPVAAASGAGAGAGTDPGTRAGAAWRAGGGSRMGWVVAAAALLVLVLVLFLPDQTDRVTAPGVTTPAAGSPGVGANAPFAAPGAGGGMPPLSSDMRTNADRLFNRIMVAAEEGDRAEVARFMPMAVQAYGMVDELDEDGLYHLAILHLTAGEYAEARRTAQRILDGSPDHLLGLGAAASAATEAGDTAAARRHWERLLDAYPEESGKPLPEYVDHPTMLTQYRDAAREATGRS